MADWHGRCAQALEEEVVVERHARMIEQARVHGISSILYDDVFHFLIVSRFTRCKVIEFHGDHILIVRPCYLIAFRGE